MAMIFKKSQKGIIRGDDRPQYFPSCVSWPYILNGSGTLSVVRLLAYRDCHIFWRAPAPAKITRCVRGCREVKP